MARDLTLLAGGLVVAAGAAAAPPLPDPTRPPLLTAPAPPTTLPRAALRPVALRAATAAAAEPAEPAAATPQVQSVHLPAQGQPSALVDGRLLRPGDRLAGPWGERAVLAIDHQGLLLAAPTAGRAPLRLWLLAAVAAPAAAPAPDTPPPATVAARSKP